MKRMLSIGAVLLATVSVARPPNYDESKVAPYALEDPLAFADGTKLSAVAQWPARRAEIVRIFEREMYGRTPPKPEAVVTELREEGPTLGGQAIRRQYRMWFRTDRSGPHLDWLVVLPNRLGGDKPVVRDGKVVCETAAKVPVLLFLNYYGNHELLDDEEVFVPEDAWLRNNATHGIAGHRIVRPVRGAQRKTTGDGAFPIETIVGRGYAVISACYGQVSPDVEVKRGDPEELAYTGVFDLWPKRDPRATDNVTALGAWAWALSRGLDLAAEIPEIDARRSVATGCSRLAKTALLACSRDERFAVCVPCQTGGGGCPLAKRDFGENVSTEMQMFPHWYCRGYGKYVDNEQAMAFDQHLLLASIAPRALLVEGFNTGWFDTKGEYLACRAASPAWTFLGRPGLPDGGFPPDFDTSLIGPSFGYVRRGGVHGISGSDWNWTLDFADAALASVPQAEGPRQASSPAKSDVLLDGFGNPHRSYGPET